MWQPSEFRLQCRNLATTAWTRYMTDLTPLYLIGTKENGIWTSAVLRDEFAGTREDESYIIGEHLPRNLPLESLVEWVTQRLRREPLLNPK